MVVWVCSVPGCSQSRKLTGVRLHSFPKDPKRRQKWTKATRIGTGDHSFTPKNTSRICCHHFETSYYLDFQVTGKKAQLNKLAVPSIFNCGEEEIKKAKSDPHEIEFIDVQCIPEHSESLYLSEEPSANMAASKVKDSNSTSSISKEMGSFKVIKIGNSDIMVNIGTPVKHALSKANILKKINLVKPYSKVNTPVSATIDSTVETSSSTVQTLTSSVKTSTVTTGTSIVPTLTSIVPTLTSIVPTLTPIVPSSSSTVQICSTASSNPSVTTALTNTCDEKERKKQDAESAMGFLQPYLEFRNKVTNTSATSTPSVTKTNTSTPHKKRKTERQSSSKKKKKITNKASKSLEKPMQSIAVKPNETVKNISLPVTPSQNKVFLLGNTMGMTPQNLSIALQNLNIPGQNMGKQFILIPTPGATPNQPMKGNVLQPTNMAGAPQTLILTPTTANNPNKVTLLGNVKMDGAPGLQSGTNAAKTVTIVKSSENIAKSKATESPKQLFLPLANNMSLPAGSQPLQLLLLGNTPKPTMPANTPVNVNNAGRTLVLTPISNNQSPAIPNKTVEKRKPETSENKQPPEKKLKAIDDKPTKRTRKLYFSDFELSDMDDSALARDYFKSSQAQIKKHVSKMTMLRRTLKEQKTYVALLTNKLKDEKMKQLEAGKKSLPAMPQPVPKVLDQMVRRTTKMATTTEPELRTFAMNLRDYSNEAYEYVRRECCPQLPSSCTIRKWKRAMNGTPEATIAEHAYSKDDDIL